MRFGRLGGTGIGASLLLLLIVFVCTGRFDASQGQPSQEAARRQFQSAQAFLRDGRVAEALKDFESIVQLFPTSDVADDALLGIAELQLDTYWNPPAARATLDQVLTKYPAGTAAPMAFVLLGRVQLAEAATVAAVDAALASFDRVRRLFPESDAVPAASYFAGEALRSVRRFSDALPRYQRVFAESPRSVWAARSRLGAARCLVQLGQPREAMIDLQRIRVRFPETPEAARAIAWTTLLYRLHVRPPAQPPYAYTGRPLSGSSARLRDIRALGVDASERIYVVADDYVRVLTPSGSDVRSFAARDARGVMFDRTGAPQVLLKAGILRPDGSMSTLSRRAEAAPKPLATLEAAIGLRSGSFLVADRESSSVYRVDADLSIQGVFSSSRPARMAGGPQDEVATLDADAKTVVVSSRDGSVLFRVAQRGGAYKLENPVDVAFDAIGYLYLLDRDSGAVLVFDPAGKFVLTFALPENAPGAFRRAAALALDAAGRLLIADDRATGILVFQ